MELSEVGEVEEDVDNVGGKFCVFFLVFFKYFG